MGEKEDRRRKLRRKLFTRDGWQDSDGEWAAMCADGCGTVITWHTSGLRKSDRDGRWTPDNARLTCRLCGGWTPPKDIKRDYQRRNAVFGPPNNKRPRGGAVMTDPKTIPEKLDAAQTGDEFAAVLVAILDGLERARDAEEEPNE